MAEVESSSILLRRLWANAWEAARFSVERPLHRPAFELCACTVQLELAAQAVVRLREAIGSDVDIKSMLPLEGRSCALLEHLLDGSEGGPNPMQDPVAFVLALVHGALQTGDGSYGLGIQGKEAVDALIAKHCEDILNSAKALEDPVIAARDIESAAAEVAEAVEGVLAKDVTASTKAQSVLFSSQVIQLSRELRNLAGRLRAVLAAEPEAETSTGEPESTTEMSDSATLDAPAFQTEEVDDAGDAHMESSEVEAPLQRTKSQVVKRIKVDEVAQAAEARREPIEQLRKALSQLDGKVRTYSNNGSASSKYDKASEELKQVQKLQQNLRNFGEDLMEGMLSLDQLSGLADEDRQAKKDTIKDLQGLLDEIDAAKPRVAKVQKKLADELDHLKPAAAAEQQAQQGMQRQPQQQTVHSSEQAPMAVEEPQHKAARNRAELRAPQVDWTRLRLPVKFSSVERSRAYILSASVAGLDPDSIRLSRREGGVLRVQGTRLPSPADQRALLRLLSEHIERMPRKRRQQLTQEDADEMLLQLGHGRFGLFQQEFELPHDVDWQGIEPSYEDGVLRVLLPRQGLTGRGRPTNGWMHGMPDSFYRGPSDFLW